MMVVKDKVLEERS